MKKKKTIKISTPVDELEIDNLEIGDNIEIDGVIYCGRDAVLPKIADLIKNNNLGCIKINLKGAAIFHTAVSPAGIGPTTSNKIEIEGNIPILSKAGVKIHIGKGALGADTVTQLEKNGSVFAITPPTSALLASKIVFQRVVAFENEGMEAFYEIEVKGFPAIIAVAHGKTIF